MDIAVIQSSLRNNRFRLSLHAEIEAEADNLDVAEIVTAILDGEIIEDYPDTGRGISCLILGFAQEKPIHIVCGMRGDLVVIVTVYIPMPPKFSDPWTRSKDNE